MKKINFTKRSLDSLPVPEKGRVRYYDAKTPGLTLRITSAGTKTFRLYRKVNGKPLDITLGRFPAMTVEQARREAQKLLGEIAEGKNPVKEKRRRQAEALTLREAVEEYRNTRPLSARSLKDLEASTRYGWGDWIDKPILSLTPEMVLKRYRQLCERGTSGAAASLWMRNLRAVLNFAANRHRWEDGTPLLLYNPVQILSDTRAWKRPQRRQRYIKPHELSAFWQALDEINPHHAALFRFQLLTGLRPSEAARLRWQDVELKARTFILPETKAHRPHTLPLSDYLMDLLKSRLPADWEYVFADDRGRMPTNFRYSREKIARLAGIEFSPYDLRRTFATIAESLDIPAYALKRLLNHSMTGDVTAGYIIADVERLREPMQRITDFILKAAGVRETATITPLQRKEG